MSENKTTGIALDGASISSEQLFMKGASIPTMQSSGGLGFIGLGAQIPVMQLAPVATAPVTTQQPVSSPQSASNSQSSGGTINGGSE